MRKSADTLKKILTSIRTFSLKGSGKLPNSKSGVKRTTTRFLSKASGNNIQIYSYFCEKNCLDMLLRLLKKTKSREIIIQIIQSLSLFLTNFEKPTNISNPKIPRPNLNRLHPVKQRHKRIHRSQL